jgi:hypothetical protein
VTRFFYELIAPLTFENGAEITLNLGYVIVSKLNHRHYFEILNDPSEHRATFRSA